MTHAMQSHGRTCMKAFEPRLGAVKNAVLVSRAPYRLPKKNNFVSVISLYSTPTVLTCALARS